MAQMLTERYRERLHGVLSCYDRIVITGTLPGICYAAGMTSFLYAKGIRIFDYARFAEPLRERIRQRAEQLAAEQGARIEYIAKTHIRKEEVVAKVLAARGEQPGLVHVISAMEACESYQPWHDKASGKTYLRPDSGKCLHYYFYFIDEKLGLCYLRVPTWCPFRLQFYCNGHSWLARKLAAAGIEFTLADNAFVQVADLERAQALADSLTPEELHRRLDRYAERLCPVGEVFGQRYHWSLMQVEYSTDLMFRSQATLKPLYEQLSRQAVLAVKAEQVASFLGKKITPQLAQEIGSRFSHPHRRHLHQAPLRQDRGEDVRQVRARAAPGDHHQRCFLLQAPPQGGTPRRAQHPRAGTAEKDHLQPDRLARDSGRMQPPLPGVSLRPGGHLQR